MLMAMEKIVHQYEDCLRRMRYTTDSFELEQLEERRCMLHNGLLDVMNFVQIDSICTKFITCYGVFCMRRMSFINS